MDIPTVVSDEDILVSTTGFHGQLTSEVGSRGIVQSKEVGSRESQSEGVEERRETSAREG